jgi:hypothetical protein
MQQPRRERSGCPPLGGGGDEQEVEKEPQQQQREVLGEAVPDVTKKRHKTDTVMRMFSSNVLLECSQYV